MRPTNQQWTIDASHSNIEFAVRHLMISTVRGRFTEVTGAIELDPDDPSEGRGEITIPVASIDTGEANRDQHLRSPDFFDAETHPTMIGNTAPTRAPKATTNTMLTNGSARASARSTSSFVTVRTS